MPPVAAAVPAVVGAGASLAGGMMAGRGTGKSSEMAEKAYQEYANINTPNLPYLGLEGVGVVGVKNPGAPGPEPVMPDKKNFPPEMVVMSGGRVVANDSSYQQALEQYNQDKAAWDKKNQAYQQYNSAALLEKYKMTKDPRDFVAALQASEMGKVSVDPALRAYQSQALSGISDIATSGLTAEDQAMINKIAEQQKTTEQGQRLAIMQNAAQRGMGGSGMELASLLGAEQGAARNASTQGTDVAALALQRKQAALGSLGTMGLAQETQQFSEEARKAEAQDLINRFNTEATNSANQAYVNAQNALGQQNTSLKNAAIMDNVRNVPQQNFDNATRLAELKANALNQIGTAQQNAANQNSAIIGNTIASAGNLIGGMNWSGPPTAAAQTPTQTVSSPTTVWT